MRKYPTEGWAWPSNSRKAHYFSGEGSRSLCRKWVRWATPYQTNQEPGGPDDCKECVRKLERRKP